jgi:hypothetical protein
MSIRKSVRRKTRVTARGIGKDSVEARQNAHRALRRKAGGREMVERSLRDTNSRVSSGPNRGKFQVDTSAYFYLR